MPPQLVALTDGPSIMLDKPILLVGRHQECDIQIQSRKISRRHCCIAQVDDYLVVRDLCWPGAPGQAAAGPPAAAPPAAARPGQAAAVPDLDSFEEPVALRDSGGQVVSKGAPLAPPPEKPIPSLIIPENLSLMPGSADSKKKDVPAPSAPSQSGNNPSGTVKRQ